MSEQPHVETTPEQIPEEAQVLLDGVVVDDQAQGEQGPWGQSNALQSVPMEKLVIIGVQAIAAIIARKVGPEMALQPEEAAALGEVWAPPVKDWIGKSDMGPWEAALAATMIIYLPKIMALAMRPPAEEKAKADEEA